ncbi:MAG TPA: deoxyribonuclease IV [Candidatus Omnitrophota bacterium]|nr:deoxyribonuclease IV [Candidatus Omnitrophota bacterium]
MIQLDRMLLGVHVSIAGHIYEAIDRAAALGCTAMQIFPRDPRQWRKTRLKPEDIEEFRLRRRQSGMAKVFIHIPYLVNLASPYNILYKGSIRAAVQDMQEAAALGAEYVVAHAGSHKDSGEGKGLHRLTQAVNRILDKTKALPVSLLLENTAGAGSWLGYRFEHLAYVFRRTEQPARLGVCLDTCHAHAAGYDLVTPAGYEQTMRVFGKQVGWEKLKLIHLNDSKDACASHRDRHEHLGKGMIGLQGLGRLVNDSRCAGAAFILETPKDTARSDRMNLARVRKLQQGKGRYGV